MFLVQFRKWTILIHRYLGIALSLIFILWFVSGIAIIYGKGMPRLTPELRLARLAPVDFSKVRLTAMEAAARAQITDDPQRAFLVAAMDRPSYRFLVPGRGWVTVFADTGDLLDDLSVPEALQIARRFMEVPAPLRHVGVITEPDQWTIGNGMSRFMPMHKIVADDAGRTELYISQLTGDVAVMTTRASRALAWAGAIPHWFYLTPLRRNNTAWRQTILWTSGVGCVVAIAGIVVGILRFSPSARFRKKGVRARIPYGGWTWWHFLLGIFFGGFTLTWVFSGMLSIQPWDWTTVEGPDFSSVDGPLIGGSLDLSLFPAFDQAQWSGALPGRVVKEVEFLRLQGAATYAVQESAPSPLLVAADSLAPRSPFSAESLLLRIRESGLDVPIEESSLRNEYDSYYYSRDREAPLPVFQVKFADPEKTWLYIDPAMSRVVALYDRRTRLERWIYRGLHSLDFSFWYYNRPLWDIGVIALSAGGIAASVFGVLLGFRRIRRNVGRRT